MAVAGTGSSYSSSPVIDWHAVILYERRTTVFFVVFLMITYIATDQLKLEIIPVSAAAILFPGDVGRCCTLLPWTQRPRKHMVYLWHWESIYRAVTNECKRIYTFLGLSVAMMEVSWKIPVQFCHGNTSSVLQRNFQELSDKTTTKTLPSSKKYDCSSRAGVQNTAASGVSRTFCGLYTLGYISPVA